MGSSGCGKAGAARAGGDNAAQIAAAMLAEWRGKAAVFAALGDTTRQQIMLLFGPGVELGVGAVVEAFAPMSRTAVWHHIRTLREAGLLNARKQGRETLLSVSREPLEGTLRDTLDYLAGLFGEKHDNDNDKGGE